MKHETFDGGWLDLREPHEVMVKHRRGIQALMSSLASPLTRIEKAQSDLLGRMPIPDGEQPTREQREEAAQKAAMHVDPPLTEDESDRMLQLEQASLVAAIAGWSLPQEVTRAALDNMAMDQYDALLKVADPYRTAIMRDLNKDTSEPKSLVPNETDPTGGSSD